MFTDGVCDWDSAAQWFFIIAQCFLFKNRNKLLYPYINHKPTIYSTILIEIIYITLVLHSVSMKHTIATVFMVSASKPTVFLALLGLQWKMKIGQKMHLNKCTAANTLFLAWTAMCMHSNAVWPTAKENHDQLFLCLLSILKSVDGGRSGGKVLHQQQQQQHLRCIFSASSPKNGEALSRQIVFKKYFLMCF